MTIHSEHPFLPPESERGPLRRFRGRLTAPVTAWTAVRTPGRQVGLTVSSMLVADGEPGEIVGLIDPDSDLYPVMVETGRVAVSVLRIQHRHLAEALAGTAPAPGGPFRIGEWTDTEWGPVPADAAAWLGATIVGAPDNAGWSMLVRARIDRIEIAATGEDPLAVWRGRMIGGAPPSGS